MGNPRIYFLLFFFCVFLDTILIMAAPDDNQRKPYIVYMGASPEKRTMSLMVHDHQNLLTETIGDERVARESKLHSYGKSFNGFVANLLPREADALSRKQGVLSVFPNTVRKLQTTRSWDFVGMPLRGTKRIPEVESDLIIGVLDTGIWPQSPSFNDKGYGPPPRRWRGKCFAGGNFTGCNNKVIGAQFSNIGTPPDPKLSPVDEDGHGTHTASTAAGVPVKGAALYGIGKGTARGGVPSARIASYKVCWASGCSDMDLLAGFDNAIADGVDVISVSIGGNPRKFFQDSIAIGAFHAMKKGIFTACSAGNDGPELLTVQNVAPWITTVAASSIDRQFVADVKLGNGQTIMGVAVNTFSNKKKMYPLTSGRLAANITQQYRNASACDYGSLSDGLVKGKIVYCLGKNQQDHILFDQGLAGIILSRERENDTPSPFLIPGTTVSPEEGNSIDAYINSTKMSVAVIHKSRAMTMADAPFVATFSSRGPQMIAPHVLKGAQSSFGIILEYLRGLYAYMGPKTVFAISKGVTPDIAAPGLGILAAYSKLASMTGHPDYDRRFVDYQIASGTSMACPHVAAAAAYVKSFHRTWSPAEIRSALMTTATPMKINTEAKELASGSGLINPTKAVNPGLVYDINASAYMAYLCKIGYNSTTLGILNGGRHQYDCRDFKPTRGVDGLNYPSMQLQVAHNVTNFYAIFKRIAKNVGDTKATYEANVVSPLGVKITVTPPFLRFEKLNQKLAYTVVVEGRFVKKDGFLLSGSIEWRDPEHSVVSPVSVYRYIPPVF